MTTISTDDLRDILNTKLQSHPKYEDWMQFDSVELVNGIFVPRYKSPKSAGVEMSNGEAADIYRAVCSSVIDPK